MFSRFFQKGKRLPWFLLILFAGSGCAALIYEVIWFHLLRLVIGGSAVSLGILLASFMGGMCLGSLLFHRFCSTQVHPLRVYALLELGIGALGILMPMVIPLVSSLYNPWAGYGYTNIAIRALVCVICLLPPTALMGATLPAISRWMETSRVGIARLGFFYGANIAGAVIGVLLAGFYLLRFFDIYIATAFAASLNIGIGFLGWMLSRKAESILQDQETGPKTQRVKGSPALIVIGLSGVTALGAQVVWTRLLSLLFGGTVYTFSVILSVFLSGLGIGSVLGARISKKIKSPQAALGVLQLMLVVAIPLSAAGIMTLIPNLHFLAFEGSWEKKSVDDVLRCALAILPATILWGASFPMALAVVAVGGRDPGKSVGQVYAANTVGAIVGALLFSSIMIPAFGSRASQQILTVMAAIAAGLMLVSRPPVPAATKRRKKKAPSQPASATTLLIRGAPIIALAAFTTLLMPHLHPGMIGFGRDVSQWDVVEFIHISEGVNASVAVSNEEGYRNFHMSGKVVASNLPQDMRLQRMLGHVPALIHPNPKSVLILGFGAGVTAGTFALYSKIEKIVIVEIEPAVPAASGIYFRDENYDILNDPRTVMIYDDARHYVATTDETFDIITADPIHPWVKGAAALYTVEFFQLCQELLNPGGLLTQWVPLYETNEEAVKSEIRTIFEIFPYATVWNSDEGIVGYDVTVLAQQGPIQIDAAAIDDRLRSDPSIRQSLAEVNLLSALALLKTFAGDRQHVQDWLADGELNLDRNLRLEYLAGQAHNTWVESQIYDGMTAHLTYPDGLFRVSESEERILRTWFRDIYGNRN